MDSFKEIRPQTPHPWDARHHGRAPVGINHRPRFFIMLPSVKKAAGFVTGQSTPRPSHPFAHFTHRSPCIVNTRQPSSSILCTPLKVSSPATVCNTRPLQKFWRIATSEIVRSRDNVGKRETGTGTKKTVAQDCGVCEGPEGRGMKVDEGVQCGDECCRASSAGTRTTGAAMQASMCSPHPVHQ